MTKTRRSDGRGRRLYKHADDLKYQKQVGWYAMQALASYTTAARVVWDPSGDWALGCLWFVPDRRTRDVDNLLKNVMDALSGVCFTDDRQVCDLLPCARRLDKENPRTLITLQRR